MENCYNSSHNKTRKKTTNPSSYRPICLLTTLSKIAEAIILNRIEDTIDIQLIPYQFGFRKNLSTVQQLLRITEFVREGMDEGWDTGAVFLDIAKVFDRVWTDGLLYKLIVLRIPGSIIRLVATYLRGRRFSIRVGSNLPSERAIAAGLVQGSKVGRKFFNIYINDIPSSRNCQTRLCLFADDTAVMSTGASNNITNELNSYLDLLGRKSKLSLSNKLLLYKSLVRPVMSYASPVWGAAAKSHLIKLESAQNITARQITNSPWFIRNRYVAKELKLKSMKEYFKKLSTNFFNKIENSINPAVQDIPKYDPSHPKKKRRPRTLLLSD
ncbi:putative RNA-directed DNA polymerase from transposon X-element [Araneus ventricosus]|uniref:Putative RNA-directed DNA polymerase from transposon X-element n=1 Tax=Araneus ventricosus TaxID=182803 RepID=A0A4Y2ET24_ARAVE|nr:putative RNA-directed DNA polymerase from transposon X-element [Araneus ventricosus]